MGEFFTFIIFNIAVHLGLAINVITSIFRIMSEFMVCLVRGDLNLLESYIYHYLLFSSIILKITLPLFINLIGEFPDISNFYFYIFHIFRILESFFNALVLVSLIYFFSLNLDIIDTKKRSILFGGFILLLTIIFFPILLLYYISVRTMLQISFISPFVVDTFMWLLFFTSGLAILMFMIFSKKNVQETEELINWEEGKEYTLPKCSNFQYLWILSLLFFGFLLFFESVGKLVIILISFNLNDKSDYFLPYSIIQSSGFVFLFLFYLIVTFGKGNISNFCGGRKTNSEEQLN
jgi:hypothetical protein